MSDSPTEYAATHFYAQGQQWVPEATLTAALEQNERFDKRYRDAEAEVERCSESAETMLKVITEDLPRVMTERDELRAEGERLRAGLAGIRQLVDQQAEDAGLWFFAKTAAEAYVQQELRKLHAAIEAIARLRAGSGNTDVLFLLASYDYFRAETERLRAAEAECRNSRGFVAAENERLRTALTEIAETCSVKKIDSQMTCKCAGGMARRALVRAKAR